MNFYHFKERIYKELVEFGDISHKQFILEDERLDCNLLLAYLNIKEHF